MKVSYTPHTMEAFLWSGSKEVLLQILDYCLSTNRVIVINTNTGVNKPPYLAVCGRDVPLNWFVVFTDKADAPREKTTITVSQEEFARVYSIDPFDSIEIIKE